MEIPGSQFSKLCQCSNKSGSSREVKSIMESHPKCLAFRLDQGLTQR